MLKMALETHDLLRLLIQLAPLGFGQTLFKNCRAWLRNRPRTFRAYLYVFSIWILFWLIMVLSSIIADISENIIIALLCLIIEIFLYIKMIELLP